MAAVASVAVVLPIAAIHCFIVSLLPLVAPGAVTIGQSLSIHAVLQTLRRNQPAGRKLILLSYHPFSTCSFTSLIGPAFLKKRGHSDGLMGLWFMALSGTAHGRRPSTPLRLESEGF